MKLQPGTIAPHFQRQDIFGTLIDLRNNEGGITLLSFFRNAACAICNLRVHQLIERYPNYQQRGLRIVAVFESKRSAYFHVTLRSWRPGVLLGRLSSQRSSEPFLAVSVTA